MPFLLLFPPSFPPWYPSVVSWRRRGKGAPSYSALKTKVKSAQIYDQCFPKLVLLFPSAASLKREGSNERTEFGSAFFLPGLPLASHIGPMKALLVRTQRDLYIYPRYHNKKRHFYSAAVVTSSGSVFDFFKRANCYLWETERRGKAFFAKSVCRHHAMRLVLLCLITTVKARFQSEKHWGKASVCGKLLKRD